MGIWDIYDDSVSTFSMIFYERSEAATRHSALGADARRETPTSRSARRSSAVRVVACIYIQLVRPFCGNNMMINQLIWGYPVVFRMVTLLIKYLLDLNGDRMW